MEEKEFINNLYTQTLAHQNKSDILEQIFRAAYLLHVVEKQEDAFREETDSNFLHRFLKGSL
ncbi:MAG: hypothetical protein ACFE9L_14875 [Candidatus Hodarchaeota archaeon]